MLIEVKKEDILNEFKPGDTVIIEQNEYIEKGTIFSIYKNELRVYYKFIDGVIIEEADKITHIYKQIKG